MHIWPQDYNIHVSICFASWSISVSSNVSDFGKTQILMSDFVVNLFWFMFVLCVCSNTNKIRQKYFPRMPPTAHIVTSHPTCSCLFQSETFMKMCFQFIVLNVLCGAKVLLNSSCMADFNYTNWVKFVKTVLKECITIQNRDVPK